MTATAERPAPERVTDQRSLLSDHAACIMSVLRIVQAETARELRRELGVEAVQLHANALQASIANDRAGQATEIPLPRRLLTPGIIGPEVACVLALQRKQADREIAPHPTDPGQVMIAPRQVGYTI